MSNKNKLVTPIPPTRVIICNDNLKKYMKQKHSVEEIAKWVSENLNNKLTVWIITGTWEKDGKRYAYEGSWSTRKEAVYNHCKQKGKKWDECKSKGDRAQKAILIFENQS